MHGSLFLIKSKEGAAMSRDTADKLYWGAAAYWEEKCKKKKKILWKTKGQKQIYHI